MFEDVLGQARAKHVLTKMLTTDHLPYGLLLTGPEKTGKYLLACSLARAISCQGDQKAICSCKSCKKINANMHSDVHFVEPGDNGRILVDQVRAIEDAFKKTPYDGEWKICVVRHAHKLNRQAADAFLKVLEEPKGQASLILATSHPAALVDTIKSRCQQIRLTMLSDGALTQLMMQADLSTNPVSVSMMGGSFMPEAVSRDLFLLKSVWTGKESPLPDKIEVKPLRNELVFLACALAYMIRNSLSNFREVSFRRATNGQLAALFQHVIQAVGLLDNRVRPYLVLRYTENRIREALVL